MLKWNEYQIAFYGRAFILDEMCIASARYPLFLFSIIWHCLCWLRFIYICCGFANRALLYYWICSVFSLKMYCSLSHDVFKKSSISLVICVYECGCGCDCVSRCLCVDRFYCHIANRTRHTHRSTFDVVVWSRETDSHEASACETPTSKHRVEVKMYYIPAACMYIKTID